MKKIIALCSLFLLLLPSAFAGSTTYYARLVTKASGTGMGTVYSNKQKTTPSSSQYVTSSTSETVSDNSLNKSVDITFYAYAQSAADTEWSHWSKTENGTSVSTENPYTVTITATSTSKNSPTETTLYAVFKKKTTYYAQLTAYVSSSGGGKVYAGTSKTATASYTAGSSVAKGTTTTKDGGSVSFYAFAQANDGYEFSHWSSSDGGSALASSAGVSPYEVSVTTTSTSESSPKNQNVYAVFRKKVTCYAKFVAAVDSASAGLGKVAVGTTTTAGAYSATSASSAVQSIAMQDGLVNFYAFAQPNDDCEFLYWTATPGGASVSQEETHKVTVTASSEDAANPSCVTYYAVFRKIPAEPVYGSHDLSGKAVKESGSIKVFSNTTVSEAAKAFDGNTSTYFAPPTAANEAGCSWTGISFATNVIVSRIDFVGNYARRMIGGAFQGANQADFSDAENIFVVTQYRGGTSTNVLEEAKGPYRYLRFIGMYGGNVAEIKFYGLAASDGEAPTSPVVTASGSDGYVAYVSVRGDATVPQVYRVQRAMADFCEDDDYETCAMLAPQLGETVTWRDTRKTCFSKYRIQSVNGNGASAWTYFEIEPEKLIADGPAKPTFGGDLPGFYASSATVTIEYPVDGATIYYTTDGSTPTMASTRYTGPITLKDVCSRANNLCNIRANPTEITSSEYKWNKPSVDQPDVNVIRARAFLADGSASPMDAAGTWLVGSTVNEHKLRVVSIQTDYDGLFSDATGIWVPGDVYTKQGFKTDNGYGASHSVGRPNANYFMEGKDWERPTQVEIFDTNRTELLNVKMGIRVRGCWSRAASKKSLTCFARRDYGTKNIKAQLFRDEGKMKFKRFLLRNGGNDWYQLGMRDAVAQSMFRGLVKTDTQGFEPSVLYVNGEYWGVYNMRHGYCRQHFEEWNGSDGDVDFSKLDHESGNHFEVEEGDLVSLWDTHYQMAKMTSSGTMSDADFAKVEQMIDIDDLIDSHIIHIFLANIDWLSGGNNMGYWRNRTGADQRWHFAVFDTDIGMSFWQDTYGDDYINKTLNANVTDDAQTKMAPNFFTCLFKNTGFKRRFANRYADLLNTALTTNRTSAIIERELARVEHERTRNQNRWTNMQSNYSSNLTRFKNFFKNRPAKEFSNIKTRCCGSGASFVKLTVAATEGVGSVQLNSLVSGKHMTLPFTGQYFSDIPVTLTATPARGYKFASWKKGTSVVSTEATYSPTITSATTLTATFEKLAPGEDIIQGDYPNGLTVELTKPTTLKIGDATFEGPLTITGADATLALQDGTVAVIPQIDAAGRNLTVSGAGTLAMSGSERLIACSNLVVSSGRLQLTYSGTVAESKAVEMTGSYLQTGGDVTMDLASSATVYGFWCDTKKMTARIQGGTFATTIDGGEKSATFKLEKGSNDVSLEGGAITVNLAGTAPRFVNTKAKLSICGSEIEVNTLNGADGTTPAGANARVFKCVEAMTISDGLVKGSALGAGSEMFSSDNKIKVTGGTVSVVADDDCFSAATNITVSAGKVHALSQAGDALDSNGNMVISGGYVFAFALGEEGEGLDVDPKDGETDGLDHTLVISGGTVVAVGSENLLHAPDAGSVVCYAASSMASDKKYVEVSGLQDGLKTTATVNWLDRHAERFSLIATCPDFIGSVTTTNTKPNKDLPTVSKLDANIDGVFLTVPLVVPVVSDGEDEPGSGVVPAGCVSRFDQTAKYDGLGHTIDTNALVAAVAASGQAVAGLKIEYAQGTSDAVPTAGWSAAAPAFAEKGEYYVWYRISAPDYKPFVHVAKVSVRVISVVINEVQSGNDETILDEFGEDADWAELFNEGEEAVDLSGWGFSDKATKPYKWTFPAGTTIAPRGYLVVFCGGVAKTGTQLHSSLSLSGSGETLTLTDLSGTAVDSLEFGALPADTSFGRQTLGDGTVVCKWFAKPTPGAANTTTAYEEPLGPVVFSRERGVFTGSTSFGVTLSHTNAAAKIYYTTDHSDPSPTNAAAKAYGGESISVSKTTVLRATAVLDGHLPYRNVVSHSYLYLDQIVNQTKPSIAPDKWTDTKRGSTSQSSCTASYTVSTKTILTDATKKADFVTALGKAPVMSITLSDYDLFDNNNGIYCKPVSKRDLKKAASVEWVTGNHVFCTDAGLTAHGDASRHFEYTPKKSFGLKFRGRFGASKLDKPVMDDIGYGCDEFKTLVLRAESNHSWTHLDGPQYGTYMHDQFLRDLFGEMTGVQSHGNQVHLFINGLYWGLYNVVESIDDHFAAAHWGGDNSEYDVVTGNRYEDTGAEVRDGSDADFMALVSELKALGAGSDMRKLYETACEKIDIDMMIDYMMLEYWSGNTDWPHKNWVAVMSAARNVPLKYIAWDIDRSMMNLNDNQITVELPSSTYPTVSNCVQVVERLLEKSSEYKLRFADHVHKHFFNDGVMTSAALVDRYQMMASRVRPMVYAEVARWGAYKKDYENGTLYNMDTWDTEYNRLTGTYFPGRWAKFKDMLKNQGLYPSIEAAEFTAQDEGAGATLSVPSGTTVYYTTDGSDPREAYTGTPVGTTYASGSVIAATTADLVVRARAYNASTKTWSAISEISLTAPIPEINAFLPQGNGESWDVAENWARHYYPNAAGEEAVIGVPTGFKKGKGWRNIHVNASDVTVGRLEITNGGCTNRIDTGDVGGSLVLSGKDGDASVVVTDEDNPGLTMIDLDEPGVLSLGTDTDFVVSNQTGDVNYGGLLIKGAIAGNGNNLQKLGPGRLTIAATNAAGTVLGNLQAVEGVVAVETPLTVASVTKKTGTVWVKAGETQIEDVLSSALVSGEKVNPKLCLFVPTNGVNALWYGGVVSPALGPASLTVYLPDAAGTVRFAGLTWSVSADAQATAVALADGRLTYEIQVPVPPLFGGEAPGDFDTTVTYDGAAHTLRTNDLSAVLSASPVPGLSVAFASGTALSVPSEGWTAMAPSFVDAGDHVVWYKVSAPGYVDVTYAAHVKIAPFSGVVVKIVGNCATNTYNGSEQSVAGYAISANSVLYDVKAVTFSGQAVAVRTDVGTTKMGLAEDAFGNGDANFANVAFDVTNGELVITSPASSGETEYKTFEEAVAAATSANPITFVETPSVDSKNRTITPKGGTPIAVPDYYDISLAGNTVTFVLNAAATPVVTSGTPSEGGETIPAFTTEAGTGGDQVGVGTTTREGLYYALEVGTVLNDLSVPGGTKWTRGNGGVMQLQAPKPAGAADRGFYRVVVSDVEK